ncbi:NAD(P)/FAD-dependent oxidoreductase [Rhizobium straminoryzae]|uniref:NAD(P)/FAD-dependent oxidoreductase n=1 Tax=Rhizobium straminoryzae TaxID=1387186 RepID=UPI0024832CDF|nr:FAD-binding oxidoreductase [Rhizobium straminoryzae]
MVSVIGQLGSSAGDSAQRVSGQSASLPAHVDLLIVGGGIMGLWAAVKAERQGIRTLLLDALRPASGASGGLLGALMPHMPDRFGEKKKFQFDALIALEDEVKRLEAETGLSCGYRRCGRIIPLPKPHLRPIAARHGLDAAEHWRAGERQFAWTLLDASPDAAWIHPQTGPSGFVHDTLAARVSPRALTAALLASIESSRHVQRINGRRVLSLEAQAAVLETGERIGFGHAIIAAGTGSFPLLEQLGGACGEALVRPLGSAVKGQAALLKADVDPARPVIFLNGLYVVAHEGGHVAIGSTSEDQFEDGFSTDGQLDALIARARDMSPDLQNAEVVERWAGLRPKAVDRDPMVGPHPDHAQVIALTGGFKVSFGLAHRLADAALAGVSGQPADIPSSFALSHHLQVAGMRA